MTPIILFCQCAHIQCTCSTLKLRQSNQKFQMSIYAAIYLQTVACHMDKVLVKEDCIFMARQSMY